MDAKRRRLSKSADPVARRSPPRDLASPSRATRSSTTMAKHTELLLKEVTDGELDKAQKSLAQLKKKLSSATNVLHFLRVEKSLEALVEVFYESFNKLRGTEASDAYANILRESVSVIANCCHFSLESCLRLKSANARVIQFAFRILESGALTSIQIKAGVLRLVANLCEHKETAMCIAEAHQLVDRVSLMINLDDESTSRNALRIVKLLAANFSKSVILSNACNYIGQLLNRIYGNDLDPRKGTILTVLHTLGRNQARAVGRQLAAGITATSATYGCCTKELLTLVLKNPHELLMESDKRWLSLTILLARNSFEFREIFGENAILEAANIENSYKNANLCKFLVFFAYDAWGRAKLRETGLLTKILRRLDETNDLDEREIIVTALRHFIHDTIGMGFLCRHSIFTTIALKHLGQYLQNKSYMCTTETKTEEDLLGSLDCVTSGVMVSVEDSSGVSSERLYKEYSRIPEPVSPSCNWSPSMSSYSNSLSPSPSSTSDDLCSLNWAGGLDSDDSTPRPSMDDRFTLNHLSFGANRKPTKEEQAIAGEMFILSWLSHEEANHKYLINKEIVSALVGYISRAPTLDLKAARSLKRLARSRACIHQLLEIHFHTIVVHYLLRQPCTLFRNAKPCERCDKRREYGIEVLREFSTHIDSEFGWSYLSQSLKSADEFKRLSGCVAGLILLRSGHHRKRFMQMYEPLEEIWKYLTNVLLNKNAFEEDGLSTKPAMSCQILVSLSILISSFPALREDHDSVSAAFLIGEDPDKCYVASLEEGETSLKFINKKGMLLAAVPKARCCALSEYFRGMFGSEFLETVQNRQNFAFDPASEECEESDFTSFLHFLSGCRSKKCFNVSSTKTCVAMLYLADKYLCTELSEHLLHPSKGVVRRLLNGTNLHEFLPVCLNISRIDQKLGKMCMRTMLQYSTDEQLTKTLETLVGDARGVQLFVGFLKEFVDRYALAWMS